jgi:undecaprenyldiphospho-muramoylpentapeptide beta-N-acetylglucosaminyltransferase
MRLLICAGMTGGGVYPALAVRQTMDIEKENVLWIGSENPLEADLLATQDINFRSIPAAGMHGVGFSNLPGNLFKIIKGFIRSRQIMQDFQPDVIFHTGGFISFPVSLAARQTPSVVFIPDIEPGTALKYLINHCTIIAVSTESTLEYLPKNKRIEITGYPIRPAFANWTKVDGKKELGLHDQLPVILVYGGSKGSRSINQALNTILPELLKEVQIIHITGVDNWDEVKESKSKLSNALAENYHPYPFLHDQMGAALASADLAVCRSGASTLGELPFFNLPAILVPYPYAWQYQNTNAEYLVRHGGAILLKDQDLQEKLLTTINSLIHDRSRLSKMSAAMRSLSHPNAVKKIGNLLIEAGHMKEGRTTWSV